MFICTPSICLSEEGRLKGGVTEEPLTITWHHSEILSAFA